MSDKQQNISASTATASSRSETPNDGRSATDPEEGLTFARRGEQVSEEAAAKDVDGFDAERMRDRSLLTAAEEKALLRKIDWRLMTVCSILFLIKNIDADNISNARIMNKGTDRNIMKQLGMTSDQYNLLAVLYYVSYHNYMKSPLPDYSPSNRFRTSFLRPLRISSSSDSLHRHGNLASWLRGVLRFSVTFPLRTKGESTVFGSCWAW